MIMVMLGGMMVDRQAEEVIMPRAILSPWRLARGSKATLPKVAVAAGPEPEMAPKTAFASTQAMGRPPRTFLSSSINTLMSRVPRLLAAMMLPATMKKGTASRAFLVMASKKPVNRLARDMSLTKTCR